MKNGFWKDMSYLPLKGVHILLVSVFINYKPVHVFLKELLVLKVILFYIIYINTREYF